MPSTSIGEQTEPGSTTTLATVTGKDKAGEAEAQGIRISPLPIFKPDLWDRAWTSIPHPTLPLIATAHKKAVTVFSLATLSSHSSLTGGHTRSVRTVAWKPNLPPHKLCLVSGSFDSTAGLWRWEGRENKNNSRDRRAPEEDLEIDVVANGSLNHGDGDGDEDDEEDEEKEWEFTLVLEGHDSEIKSAAFSPSGQYLATCSRDKSVWIWEDVGASEADDEWETVAVLSEHDGDVKAVAWCPDFKSSTSTSTSNTASHSRHSSDVLASASYDDTVRIWREDGDGEWVCVAVLTGHEETVWNLQWEPSPRPGRFPRLMSCSADSTIRVWTLKEEDGQDEEQKPQHAWSGLGAIPNTMRRSLKEEWECTAILPKVHSREIYSIAWSKESGLVASTGGDGLIVLYRETYEQNKGRAEENEVEESSMELDGEEVHNQTRRQDGKKEGVWEVAAKQGKAHGPWEVNHVTWCKRYDTGCPPERRGIEEMLVSTGDDGAVKPWQIALPGTDT